MGNSCHVRLGAHRLPERFDMLAFGEQGADGDADHPLSVEDGRCKIRLAGAIDAVGPSLRVGVERLAGQPGGLVPDAQSLQRHRGQHAPMGRLADCVEQPLRVGQVAAQAGLQSGDALLADQEPELQGAEAPSQRQAPVAQVLDLVVGARAQIAGTGGHDADEVLGIAHVIQRAIEGHAEPLVGIEHQRIGAFDSLPHPAAFRKQHGGAGHGGVDVQPEAELARDPGHGGEGVERGGGGGPGGADDGAGFAPGREVGADGRFQSVGGGGGGRGGGGGGGGGAGGGGARGGGGGGGRRGGGGGGGGEVVGVGGGGVLGAGGAGGPPSPLPPR